ncbi:MAG: hypothetical protein CMC55_06255 [Flavobacteriaceae bacterium]|uniref:hypothetical protein n=1 Tax=Bizionia echini TaxID=649333 RepID=UPI000C91AD6E|nr:hypothetical protein [Flavobacteriaceae bacterium]|tara:strand:- start:483 stop:680 length:198 start_codon:yes stop_codon:yes gene_type:complete
MENPFKKIVHNEQLPEIIKQKVLADIDVIKLALDVTGLITIKYPLAIQDFFGVKNNNKNKSDENN